MLKKRTTIAGAVLALLVLTAGPAVAGCPPEIPDTPSLDLDVVDHDRIHDKVELPSVLRPRTQ